MASVPFAAQQSPQGAVYVATNDATANSIVAHERLDNGRLSGLSTTFATGGQGTGGPLGNQGGLALDEDERFLLAVNAGSNEVSVFRVHPDALELEDVESSGGMRPISIAIHDDVVFVLNAGGLAGAADVIAGFRLDQEGQLQPIAGSVQPLSKMSTDPAQIGFTRDGSVLLVTEKATSMITTYLVACDGTVGPPQPQASAGLTPFGFAVGNRDQVFVSEAFDGATNGSAVSAYEVNSTGQLLLRDGSVPTTETAACWVALSPGAFFAFTTNTGSDTITGFSIGFEADLTLLHANGVSARSGDMPIDQDFSSDGQFLYNLNSGDGSIFAFELRLDSGRLHKIDEMHGLPLGSNGLIAR